LELKQVWAENDAIGTSIRAVAGSTSLRTCSTDRC
jgi:hypothetical protein